VALLVADLGERPAAVRVDLAVLTADLGIAAVADVPPGAHHVSVLLSDGWQHGWIWVEHEDETVRVGGAGGEVETDAVVTLPVEGAENWSMLTAHLSSRDAVFASALSADGDTRFEQAVASHGGADGVLAALVRSFLEWILPADGLDEAAGERWLALVVAVAAAGPPGIEAHPALLTGAAGVLTVQLAALPPDAMDDSLADALADLADDLADAGLAEPAALLRAARR
jgi:hypothetical protein